MNGIAHVHLPFATRACLLHPPSYYSTDKRKLISLEDLDLIRRMFVCLNVTDRFLDDQRLCFIILNKRLELEVTSATLKVSSSYIWPPMIASPKKSNAKKTKIITLSCFCNCSGNRQNDYVNKKGKKLFVCLFTGLLSHQLRSPQHVTIPELYAARVTCTT